MNWQLELAESGRRGAPIGLLYGPQFNGTSARRAARAIADAIGRGVYVVPRSAARKNPTLVHHGIVHAARWHVTGVLGAALADLYVDDVKTAKQIAGIFADWTGAPVNLLDNRKTPATLAAHPRKIVSRARSNPSRTPRVGEVWTDWRTGIKCKVLEVRGASITYLEVGTGNRLRESVLEFVATHKGPRNRVNPKGRKKAKAAGAWGVSGIGVTGAKVWLSKQGYWTAGKSTAGRWTKDDADNRARQAYEVGVVEHGIKIEPVSGKASTPPKRRPPARSRARFNPSRSKTAKAKRAARRRTVRTQGQGIGGRRTVLALAAGQTRRAQHYALQSKYRYRRRHAPVNPRLPQEIKGYLVSQLELPELEGIALDRAVGESAKGALRLLEGNPRTRRNPGRKGRKRGRLARKGSRMSRPRRSNPRGGNRAQALSTYRRLNQVEPGKITRVSAPSALKGHAVRIGELHSLVYSSDKYAGQKDNPHGKTLLYEHRTKRPRPVLATDASGREVHIVGGRMHPTPDGLVN